MTRVATRSVDFGAFRVDFVRQGDRIAHVVYAASPADDPARPGRIELLRSVESSADAAWLASPPLQELHVEERGGEPVALLVGRAGKNHWSASIGCERDVANDDGNSATGRQKLVIDIACRVSSLPTTLASTYDLAGGVECVGEMERPSGDGARGSSTVLLSFGETRWRLSADAGSSVILSTDAQRLSVRPISAVAAAPATIRWRGVLSAAADDRAR